MRPTPEGPGDAADYRGEGLLRDRRGAAGAWMALMLVVLLGVATMVIDMSFLWVLRDRLQSTADAAALAGASQLTETPDSVSVRAEAVSYAQKNMSTGAHGTVLANTDVELGHWHGKEHHDPEDSELRTFVTNVTGTAAPSGETTNAVRVTTRRAEANGNPAALFLATVLGIQKADVVTEAIAISGQGECFMFGIVVGHIATLGDDARIGTASGEGTFGPFCLYARDEVNFLGEAEIGPSSFVGALDSSKITFGEPPENDGLLIEANLVPVAANNVDSIIDDLENGVNWPDQINNVVVGGSLPGTLISGTAYIVNGDITIGSDYTLKDVIIAARGDITWDEDGLITNIDAPSGICNPGAIAIGVLATGDIILGEDTMTEATELIAGGDMNVGDDFLSLTTSIQVKGDLTFAGRTRMKFIGCQSSIPAAVGGVGTAYRLVN